MTDKYTYRKWSNEIFYFLLIAAILVLLIKWPAAVRQNKEFARDQNLYFQAVSLLNSKDSSQAEKLLAIYAIKWPDNPQVLWPYALALYSNHEYAKAETYMQKAEEAKPGLLTDPKFVIQHAGILAKNKKITEANFYLNEARKLTQDPQLIQFADLIAKEIAAENR